MVVRMIILQHPIEVKLHRLGIEGAAIVKFHVFAEVKRVSFPIIADQLGKLSLQLGMISPNLGSSTVRTVYIVNPKGIIQLMLNYPPSVGRNIDEILRVVKALQVTSENGVATPVN